MVLISDITPVRCCFTWRLLCEQQVIECFRLFCLLVPMMHCALFHFLSLVHILVPLASHHKQSELYFHLKSASDCGGQDRWTGSDNCGYQVQYRIRPPTQDCATRRVGSAIGKQYSRVRKLVADHQAVSQAIRRRGSVESQSSFSTSWRYKDRFYQATKIGGIRQGGRVREQSEKFTMNHTRSWTNTEQEGTRAAGSEHEEAGRFIYWGDNGHRCGTLGSR